MSYSERTHPNKDYRYNETSGTNRYINERSRKPYAANVRSSTPEPSRSSSVFTEPYQRHPAATPGDARYPPQPYPHKETFSEKCSNLCSRRGILQFVEVILNILVLVCIGAAQASLSGFSAMAGLGSFSLDSAYSPFEGTELQEVRDLDMQYSQMRAPCVFGGVAFSLAMMCLTLLFLIGGGKPIYRLSVLFLGAEFVFDILACLGYIAAVGLYLHFVIQVNATDVCRRRERLYARRGYTSMDCSVQGGDASVALFGLLAACLYFASAVVCALTIRSVREFKRQEAKMQYDLERTYREGEHPKAHKSPGSSHSVGTFATLV